MRWIVAAVSLAIACGPAGIGRPASVPSTSTPPTPTPINVDDMMGGSFSPATVFAQVGSEIAAVKLQNHYVAYRIPVSGKPHAVSSSDGARLYVADRAQGRTRVRSFDTANGVEVSAASVADEEAADGRALVQDRPDRLLLLLIAGAGVRVEAVSASSTAALGGVYKAPCGDRLLASPSRVAVVCSTAGKISIGAVNAAGAVHGPEGGGLIDIPGAPIVASAMLADGTIVVGAESGVVYRIRSGTTALVTGPELEQRSIVPDGIAGVAGDRFVIVTQANGEASARAHFADTGILTAGPYGLRMPASHVVALWPFVYFGSVSGIYHVDLQSGLLERMQQLDRPIPLAVAAR
jgi:hypothetical protein